MEEKNDFFVTQMTVKAPDDDFEHYSENCLIKTIGAKNNRVEPVREERPRPRQRTSRRSTNRRN